MKPLKSYITEGIFDIDASTADDFLNRETCVDAVMMLSGLDSSAMKDSARKLISDLYDKESIQFDMDEGLLSISTSPEIYNLNINKKFISKYKGIIKRVMLLLNDDPAPIPQGMYYISFDYDLNNVDMGGMTFSACRFIIPSYLTLVNVNFHCYKGSVSSIFIGNKFKKVNIGIDDDFRMTGEPNEFLKSYYPTLIFVQTAGDKSDVFAGLTLKKSSSCKFNLSLACTVAGQEMRELLNNDNPDTKKEIGKIFGSNLKSIAEIDYMYTKDPGSYGAGHVYNVESGKVSVEQFRDRSTSDYERAQRWQKVDNALPCE